MIKKIINVVVISLTGLMIFVGCSFSNKSNQSNVDNTTNVENNKSIEERQVMNTVDFENLLSSQPVSVINTEYVVQDESFKALYPDLLTVSIKNNTDQDIKNAVVSFVAWDENNLPVKIEGQFDFSDTTYVKKVNFSDINLVAGGTFDENSGLALSENSKIKTFKAIVESYETFDGTTWKNPYYDEFCTLYEGKKLIES